MAEQCIILMGVSRTGKSIIGQVLAHALGVKFIDGDDLHPRNNIVKMATSQPLNDEDRQSWLTCTADVIFSPEQKNESGALVCSALKKHYRSRLREGNAKLRFLQLIEDYDCILQQMCQRRDHFMPETLLRGQFTALETPDANESGVLTVDVTPGVANIIAHSLMLLHSQQPQRIPTWLSIP